MTAQETVSGSSQDWEAGLSHARFAQTRAQTATAVARQWYMEELISCGLLHERLLPRLASPCDLRSIEETSRSLRAALSSQAGDASYGQALQARPASACISKRILCHTADDRPAGWLAGPQQGAA